MKSSVLYLLISLSGMVFGAEIVASHITQSIVLLISAYHMLYNILSLLLLVISHRMSKGKTLKNTFGWARVKVVGLLVNMLFLGALCFAASVSAVQTMVHASHEDTTPMYPLLMVILGIINFSLNVLCFLLIGGYTHHQGCSMIIQGDDVQVNCVLAEAGDNPKHKIPSTGTSRWCNDHRILDIFRDVSSCLTVIACGCVILFMDGLILKYADAILAIASIIVLLSTTYPFVRESGLILLQSIPSHIDVNGLTKRLTAEMCGASSKRGARCVAHFAPPFGRPCVWRLTTSEVIATVHIILSSSDIYPRIEGRLNQFFFREGISSATIQPEFANGSWYEKSKQECILQCSVNNNCGALTCCGPFIDKSKQNNLKCRNSHGHKISVNKLEPPTFVNNLSEQNFMPQYDFSQINSATETAL